MLKAGLCILTTTEMSYANGQNAAKYNQCINKNRWNNDMRNFESTYYNSMFSNENIQRK